MGHVRIKRNRRVNVRIEVIGFACSTCEDEMYNGQDNPVNQFFDAFAPNTENCSVTSGTLRCPAYVSNGPITCDACESPIPKGATVHPMNVHHYL